MFDSEQHTRLSLEVGPNVGAKIIKKTNFQIPKPNIFN